MMRRKTDSVGTPLEGAHHEQLAEPDPFEQFHRCSTTRRSDPRGAVPMPARRRAIRPGYGDASRFVARPAVAPRSLITKQEWPTGWSRRGAQFGISRRTIHSAFQRARPPADACTIGRSAPQPILGSGSRTRTSRRRLRRSAHRAVDLVDDENDRKFEASICSRSRCGNKTFCRVDKQNDTVDHGRARSTWPESA